jgi:hypothetical protein
MFKEKCRIPSNTINLTELNNTATGQTQIFCCYYHWDFLYHSNRKFVEQLNNNLLTAESIVSRSKLGELHCVTLTFLIVSENNKKKKQASSIYDSTYA